MGWGEDVGDLLYRVVVVELVDVRKSWVLGLLFEKVVMMGWDGRNVGEVCDGNKVRVEVGDVCDDLGDVLRNVRG